CILATTRAEKFSTTIFCSSSSLMNRRIPDGTYGGVRGRELVTPSYSIFDKGGYRHVIDQGNESDSL
ncbi:hypothetical protein P4307_26475, partial [Brevibacillus porteri]|uniref:hypothetical protein n=1 Tax=Brevibacillus porteri TaxID=2126350 RepID=UPI002E228CC7|nr:hypothetical protein [Brevibacillus porteri]